MASATFVVGLETSLNHLDTTATHVRVVKRRTLHSINTHTHTHTQATPGVSKLISACGPRWKITVSRRAAPQNAGGVFETVPGI